VGCNTPSGPLAGASSLYKIAEVFPAEFASLDHWLISGSHSG